MATDCQQNPALAHVRAAVLCALLVASTPLLGGPTVVAQDASPDPLVDSAKASKIKAVYLYSFGRFTKWPGPPPDASKRDFTISIVGTSDIESSLVKIAKKRTIQDHAIRVTHCEDPLEISERDCDMVFVSRTVSQDDLAALMRRLRDIPVLTVTESTAPPVGTVLNFVLEGDSIHFEINIEEAQRKKLALDARLLRQGRKMLPSDHTLGSINVR
jgi:hypothetical protein